MFMCDTWRSWVFNVIGNKYAPLLTNFNFQIAKDNVGHLKSTIFAARKLINDWIHGSYNNLIKFVLFFLFLFLQKKIVYVCG